MESVRSISALFSGRSLTNFFLFFAEQAVTHTLTHTRALAPDQKLAGHRQTVRKWEVITACVSAYVLPKIEVVLFVLILPFMDSTRGA